MCYSGLIFFRIFKNYTFYWGGLTCYGTYRDHITCGNQFFPSTMWVPKLRSQAWGQASFPSSSLFLLWLLFCPVSLLTRIDGCWSRCGYEAPQMSRYFPTGTHWLTYVAFLVSSRSQDPKPSSQRNCLINLRRFLEYHTSSFVSDFSPCWNKIPDKSILRKQGKVYIQSQKEGTFGQGGKRIRQPVALCPQSGSRERQFSLVCNLGPQTMEWWNRI